MRDAHDVLRRAGVFDVLGRYEPTMAGTLPLGLDVEGSDVDVLCAAPDLEAFVRDALAFAAWPAFSLHRREGDDPPAVVCRFVAEGLPVEIFAQALPVRGQRAYRHMVAERRLLAAAGEGAAEEIRRLKRIGIETEPAFAEHFALVGNPYQALLEAAGWSDARIASAVARGARVRAECPFCAVVAGDEEGLAHRDTQTVAFPNRRQANRGHLLVVPRRHIPSVFDLDADTAAALGRAIARVARALRNALGVADMKVWQSNGEAAGQEIAHVHVHVLPRRPGDGLFRVYPPDRVPPACAAAELRELAGMIRAAP